MTREDSGATKPTRAFVALDFDPASHVLVVRAAETLRKSAPSQASLRWTAPEQLHVTVKFLGSVSESVLEAIGDAVRALGGEQAALSARLETISALPSLARATVLAGALEDPTGRLGALARRLEEGARAAGVPPEDRTYRPHVTVARLRGPTSVRRWIDETAFAPVAVRLVTLTLYRSDSSPSGVRYTPIARVALA